MRNVSATWKGDGSNARTSDTSSPEMLKERKSTHDMKVKTTSRGEGGGCNEGWISLEISLEIGWPFGVCDISLKVLWAADSNCDSRCWHAVDDPACLRRITKCLNEATFPLALLD